MMSPRELITILTTQHRGLEADLALALEKYGLGTTAGIDETLTCLMKFREDLMAHLHLEDTVFYPDYFQKKLGDAYSESVGNEFMKQMAVIAKTVVQFLDTYATAEAIKSSEGRFRDDLMSTTSILKIRIETEEEELYRLYVEMSGGA